MVVVLINKFDKKVFAQRPAQVDPFQNHFRYASSIQGYNTDMFPNKIYVNLKCAITLENA